ncbi:protein phosphatase 2C domain-containing protein [Paenibacillus sp. TRM 82003]|nr:protein phosphatase 2C domain-containing protein [Paenibacillus sp. TRM 82003]
MGQDYLTVIQEGRTVYFAVCDGVSLSYYGDVAARFVGDAMLEWLTAIPNEPAETLQSLLERRLREWTVPATETVLKHDIPSNVAGMLREVLEEKKKLGSESTFVCGRIDLPDRAWPDGRLTLAWMGDTRIRLWCQDEEMTSDLGDYLDTGKRWSTARGPLGGSPNVYVRPLETGHKPLNGISVYSDGLARMDDTGRRYTDEEVQRIIDEVSGTPASDDIAFLDVRWREASVAASAVTPSRKQRHRSRPSLYALFIEALRRKNKSKL